MQAKPFVERDVLMSRANSLKKAVRQLVEYTEQAVDQQNTQINKPSSSKDYLYKTQAAARHSMDGAGCSKTMDTLKVTFYS